MTEFQELVKNAPNFVSMARSELVVYAYAMYAVGVKTEAKNAPLRQRLTDVIENMGHMEERYAKLHKLAVWMYHLMDESCAVQHPYAPEPIRYDTLLDVYKKLRELGIEV